MNFTRLASKCITIHMLRKHIELPRKCNVYSLFLLKTTSEYDVFTNRSGAQEISQFLLLSRRSERVSKREKQRFHSPSRKYLLFGRSIAGNLFRFPCCFMRETQVSFKFSVRMTVLRNRSVEIIVKIILTRVKMVRKTMRTTSER